MSRKGGFFARLTPLFRRTASSGTPSRPGSLERQRRHAFAPHLARVAGRCLALAGGVFALGLCLYTVGQIRHAHADRGVPLPVRREALARRLNRMGVPGCFLRGAEIIVSDFELPLLVPNSGAHYWPGSRQIRLSRAAFADPEHLVHEVAHHYFDHVASPQDIEELDRLLLDEYWPRVYRIWQTADDDLITGLAGATFVIASARGSNLPAKMDEFRADVVAYYLAPPFAVRTCDAEPVREAYAEFRELFSPWFRRFDPCDRVLPGDLDVTPFGGWRSFPAALGSNARRVSGAVWLCLTGARPNTGPYPITPGLPGSMRASRLQGRRRRPAEPLLARCFPFAAERVPDPDGGSPGPLRFLREMPNSCPERETAVCSRCRRLARPRFSHPPWRPPGPAFAVSAGQGPSPYARLP